jgi:hypothetical protein
MVRTVNLNTDIPGNRELHILLPRGHSNRPPRGDRPGRFFFGRFRGAYVGQAGKFGILWYVAGP